MEQHIMTTKDYILNYQEHVGSNIQDIMKRKKITQKEMEIKCADAGFTISQATISNAKRGNGNITISTLLAIAYALDVDIMELLDAPYSTKTEDIAKEFALLDFTGEMFITNPESIYIKCYLGTYHILFYKTSCSGDDMVHGTIQFMPNNNGTSCDVVMQIKLEENLKSNMSNIKEYRGQLVASPLMRSMYVFLSNSELGESAMILFQQIFTSRHMVETAMAVAITTASGANRRPTVHRMCLSRNEIPADKIEYIRGQLLMNTEEIFLTDKQIDFICLQKNVPESFKELLRKARIKAKDPCYRIQEASLFDSSLSEKALFENISFVRSQSVCSKYNKVSKKTDEILYSMLGKNSKKE